jgi:hypothetical protein
VNPLLGVFPFKGWWLDLHIRWKVVGPVYALGLLLGVVFFLSMTGSARRRVEEESLERAKTVISQIREVRAYYTRNVVEKADLTDETVAEAAQSNVDGAEATRSAASGMAEMAAELQSLVHQFKYE